MSTAASGLNQPGGPLFGRFAQLMFSRRKHEDAKKDHDSPEIGTV